MGINPLGGNRADPAVRNTIFPKTKALFDKLWKNTFEEKPWLQLIIQNTIYAFIENPDFTLVDFPMFFRDRDFRSFLVENMHYNMAVKDYWLKTFTSKDKYSQERIIEAAQTRCEIMFAHPAVRHFFGHTTCIDIGEYIESTTARFVKLSTRLPYEVKKIIGTALLNELVFAIQKRKTGRALYCLYIDEFQNFVSFEDMATLITQAPKFQISTTLAHHERIGQLDDDKRIIGATSTIANKVLFQVTGKDAHDFAQEFRKDPPEAEDGDIYVISQSPFYDLLQGHNNPAMRVLIDKYLRPIKERAEDLYGESETQRLLRTEYLDEANLYRVDERIATAGRGRDEIAQRGALGHTAAAISQAQTHIERLKELNEEGISIRATIRILNRLFIDMMDGKLKPGQEEFSNRLVDISKAAVLPPEDRRILELYISLAYGASGGLRILPFECAKRQGLFIEQIKKIEHAINTEYETQRAIFARRIWQIDIESILKYTVKKFNEVRRERGEPEFNAHDIEEERNRIKDYCGRAIEKYERGEMQEHHAVAKGIYLLDLHGLLYDIRNEFAPLVRRQPADCTIESSGVYTRFIKNDLMKRGFGSIVESLDGLVELCQLIAKPENHVQVKSKQRGQRVESRTVADMTNEVERELTELPKYTAYAKVLQGKKMWKGKISTHSLPSKTYTHSPHSLKFIINDPGFSRAQIEKAIQERQENWRPKVQEAEETKKEEPKLDDKKPKKRKSKKESKPSSDPPPTSYE